MGTEVHRIEKEFIFRTLMDQDVKVEVHAGKDTIHCTVADYTGDELQLRAESDEWSEISEDDEISIYFRFHENVMTCETKVLESKGEIIRVEYPEGLYKNLKRKYERVPAPDEMDLFFSFKSQNQGFPFPKSEEYNPVQQPDDQDIKRYRRLPQIIQAFRNRCKEFSSDSQIVMFREKKPRTFEERIVARLGRSLFLPDTGGSFPEKDPYPDGRIITLDALERYVNQYEKEASDYPGNSADYLAQRASTGNKSELYTPILFHQYVVGYITVQNSSPRARPFDWKIFEYVYNFSRRLAFALQLNGYFSQSGQTPASFNALVIDISASGMLVAYPSPDLLESVGLYEDLELAIRIGSRRVIINARVMRKFVARDLTYFGLQFMDMEPEDLRFLYEYLYGRKYDEDDQTKWEGGALPPDLRMFD
ncbi:MAG: DUF1577 domain-containing protein [Spirochaetales bacterium]|nr:DUF1577 domain-containing protein [Spirochaetales bacterium]MCF7937924.1 DUF1577 domain-containing protein [Spirochaetales bacterium]